MLALDPGCDTRVHPSLVAAGNVSHMIRPQRKHGSAFTASTPVLNSNPFRRASTDTRMCVVDDFGGGTIMGLIVQRVGANLPTGIGNTAVTSHGLEMVSR